MNSGKILVTGGAGYIGSHTIIELAERSAHQIISADNYCNSSAETFDRIEKITRQKVKNYNIDLCDELSVKKVFLRNTDIIGIIHFAALKSVPDSVANPGLYYHNNNQSLQNILNCLKEFNVGNFIFSSSCSVYGNIDKLPVNENTPLGKSESPYAETKQMGEKMIREFSEKNREIKSIVLRYFNPVGAHVSGLIGESPISPPTNLAPLITRTAAKKQEELIIFGNDYKTRDGTCVRDYVHVSDIAQAHILALNFLIENKNKNNFDVFNLGTGSGVSVFEAIKAFEKVSGKKLNYKIGKRREGDVEAIYSDIKKAKEVLGWEPKYNIDQMMESCWKWQLNCDGMAHL